MYKLQVDSDCHVDCLDDGPTAAFPIGGYAGREMYLPDLSLKLRSVTLRKGLELNFLQRYATGDVLIFFSGFIYQEVGHWTRSVGVEYYPRTGQPCFLLQPKRRRAITRRQAKTLVQKNRRRSGSNTVQVFRVVHFSL